MPSLPERPLRPSFATPDFGTAPWMGAPANVLGGIAPLRFVLANTPTLALTVTNVYVYGNGFTFKLTLTRRDNAVFSRRMFRHLHEPLDRDSALRLDFLRIGLAFSDGRKATNLQSTMHESLTARSGGNERAEALLRSRGASGSDSVYKFDYWAWPLPSPGPLGFVCEWPSEELPLTRHDVDAETILGASKKARLLWGETGQQYGVDGSYIHLSSYVHSQERDEDDAGSSG